MTALGAAVLLGALVWMAWLWRRTPGIVQTPGAGWTTITQRLAKDLYFDAFRPGPLA